MAQKSFPRSLRSQAQLSADFAFFSENAYARVWKQTHQLLNALWMWSQKNLLTKTKRKAFLKKRPGKKQKLPTYLTARWQASNQVGTYQISPLLFKFAHASFAKKYNPLKAMRRVRRSVPRSLFGRRFQRRNVRQGSFFYKRASKSGIGGKMAEWFIAPTWKVGSLKRIVGSNPALSVAIIVLRSLKPLTLIPFKDTVAELVNSARL